MVALVLAAAVPAVVGTSSSVMGTRVMALVEMVAQEVLATLLQGMDMVMAIAIMVEVVHLNQRKLNITGR